MTGSLKFALPFLVLSICSLGGGPLTRADEPEWKPLFDGTTLDGWHEFAGKGKCEVKDGMMHCKGGGGGGIMTDKEYANFEIELEYRTEPGGNSGVWVHVPPDIKPWQDPSYQGNELQVLDDDAKEYAHLHPEQYCGSLYDVIAAKRGSTKPAPEWNKMDILSDGRHIKVTLNGNVIVDGNYDQRPEKYLRHPGLKRTTGYIGLQNHTGPLDFRNVRIRELP
jgi:hypothetical protein